MDFPGIRCCDAGEIYHGMGVARWMMPVMIGAVDVPPARLYRRPTMVAMPLPTQTSSLKAGLLAEATK